jgi:hypothetical protein
MNTIEGNKLIAEFMGYTSADKIFYPEHKGKYLYNTKGNIINSSHLRFRSSWNSLMPVVIKCQEIETIESDNLSGEGDLDDPKCWKSWSYRYVHLDTNIERVWRACIEFIKWYNTNKK